MTIPKTRRRAKVDGPVYKELVSTMGFDPDVVPDTAFQAWDLHEQYPPTLTELTGTLAESLAPKLIGDSTDE